MSNLVAVWTAVPDDITNLEQLTKEFTAFFRYNWNDVMVGAENPYPYHCHWDAYVAIADFKVCHGLTVSDLTRNSKPAVQRLYNVIAG